MSRDILTKDDYAEYERAVDDFFEREGITNLSAIDDSEPYFSWHHCECCGGSLGGSREDCNGYNPTTKEIQEYRVCVDCVYYAEYRRLDDETMLRIEE